MADFTLDRLRDLLRDEVGVDDDVDLDGDIRDVPFDRLGYDSLAVLELSGVLEREVGIPMPDDAVANMPTPRAAVDYVNRLRAEVVA